MVGCRPLRIQSIILVSNSLLIVSYIYYIYVAFTEVNAIQS